MLAGFVFAALLAAPQLDFAQAKALADRNEANLGRLELSQLLDAQRHALDEAVKACANPAAELSRFTVVLSLNPDGSTAGSWLKGQTTFAKCVRERLADTGLAGHWPTPFYTSFELSFDGD